MRCIDSMIQKRKECLVCKTTQGLQEHHVFDGIRRQASDDHGITVWLCERHHTGDEGVHTDEKRNLALKQRVQRAIEKKYGHEKFMEIFHKSYL